MLLRSIKKNQLFDVVKVNIIYRDNLTGREYASSDYAHRSLATYPKSLLPKFDVVQLPDKTYFKTQQITMPERRRIG